MRRPISIYYSFVILLPTLLASPYPYGDKGQYIRVTEDHEQDWGRVFRLVFISGVATLTTMGNIFTISAFIVDDLLRKKGNSFLASITLADLLITAILLPASSVAVLGEMEDSENICRLQYGVGSLSCLTAAMFSAIIGIENFLRLKSIRNNDKRRDRQLFQQPPHQHVPNSAYSHVLPHSSHHPYQQHQYHQQQTVTNIHNHQPYPPSVLVSQAQQVIVKKESICTVFQVTVLNLVVWLLSGIIVFTHFIFMPQIMYAICDKPKPLPRLTNHRLNDQLLFESITVFGICTLSFVILGGFGFLKTLCIMKSWTKPKPFLTSREFALVSTNGWNWLLRLSIWLPSVIAAIVSILNESENRTLEFQNRIYLMTTMSTSTNASVSNSFESFSNAKPITIWPVILPSCLSSFVNLVTNRDFRRCYVQLFHYCCCKTSVALTRRPRDPLRAGSDVRVHIIPGYNMYSSPAVANSQVVSSTVQTRFNVKCTPLKMNYKQRDIYEL